MLKNPEDIEYSALSANGLKDLIYPSPDKANAKGEKELIVLQVIDVKMTDPERQKKTVKYR